MDLFEKGFTVIAVLAALIYLAFLGLIGWGLVELIQFLGRH